MAGRHLERSPATAVEAALAEFETEAVLARRPVRPVQRTGVVVALATVAAVVVVMGISWKLSSPAPRPAAASTAAALSPPPVETSRGLSGWWRLTSRVAETSVSRFRGLELGYDLHLEQDGRRVTGTGIKATENGRRLRSRARTPIAVDGTIDGHMVQLDFTEAGLVRTSRGRFSLRLAPDGSLTGAFWSDAARSNGTVIATR
jgi:hypothetical protein